MSETLIYVIIFALIMFFMHRGHGHGSHGGRIGSCGGHSHGSHKGHTKKGDENLSSEKENEHQHHH